MDHNDQTTAGPAIAPRPARWPQLDSVIIEPAFNGGFFLSRRDKDWRGIEPRPEGAFTDAADMVTFLLQQFGLETQLKVMHVLRDMVPGIPTREEIIERVAEVQAEELNMRRAIEMVEAAGFRLELRDANLFADPAPAHAATLAEG